MQLRQQLVPKSRVWQQVARQVLVERGEDFRDLGEVGVNQVEEEEHRQEVVVQVEGLVGAAGLLRKVEPAVVHKVAEEEVQVVEVRV